MLQMKNNNGITLIALVITIIVLLILASVTITVLLGENGIITKAKEASEIWEEERKKEEDILSHYEDKMNEWTGPFITYEEFGAVGNGVTNDAEAIRAAHQKANELYVDEDIKAIVQGRSGATYYIGNMSTTIDVKTSVDWNGATFIIDDYIDNGSGANLVDTSIHVFNVISKQSSGFYINGNELPVTVNKNTKNLKNVIDYLKNVKNRELECEQIIFSVRNSNKKQYIRTGANVNSGDDQEDTILVDVKTGNVLNDVIWDFEDITRIWFYPVDKTVLTIKNGTFISYTDNKNITNYHHRNIEIGRSNVTIDNIVHMLDETKHESTDSSRANKQSNYYLGFIHTNYIANLMIKNSKFQPHWGSGSYDLSINRSLYTIIDNVSYPCPDGDEVKAYQDYMLGDNPNDERWGIMATNYSKDIIVKNSKLNRVDAHRGVHNLTVIDSTIGVHGFTLIGSGTFRAENVIMDGTRQIVMLREDYGSTWDGTIILKNIHFKVVNANIPYAVGNGAPSIVTHMNAGSNDYGYICHYPNIIMENITIEDPRPTRKPILLPMILKPAQTYPYYMPEYITIKNVTTTSGVAAKLFPGSSGNYPDSPVISSNLYGNSNKTNVDIYNTAIDEADLSIYQGADKQFIITKH